MGNNTASPKNRRKIYLNGQKKINFLTFLPKNRYDYTFFSCKVVKEKEKHSFRG
jgi:hypothetical protein